MNLKILIEVQEDLGQQVYDKVKEVLVCHIYIDYDEIECKYCGGIGVLPNGDFDVVCQHCGEEFSLIEEEESNEE